MTLTQIKQRIKFAANYPLGAPDGNINRGFNELNDVFGEVNEQGGMSISLLTAENMLDIEARILAARMTGSEEAAQDARTTYINLLREKNVPEALLPSPNEND